MVIALLGMAAVTTASITPRYAFLPGSRVWVEGTSSVRGFTCEAAEVKGAVDASGTALNVAQLDGAVRSVEMVIDVAQLDCKNGTMNGHMKKALKATEHPSIHFRLDDYRVVASGAETQVKMNGILEIAGQERPITIDGVVTPADNGAVRVKGSKSFAMTDFGVKPPSLMMGTMKVHPNVTVSFDVVVEP
jgi:polyisoprenoid-binding protein YceI